MAYKGYRFPFVSIADSTAKLKAALLVMGWEEHDAGVKATQTFSVTAQPGNGDTVTINGKVYTFRTTLTPTEGEVLRGASAAAALDNLKAAINHTGTPDVDYKCAAAHTTVSATTNTDTSQVVEALKVGVVGHYGTTDTCANGSWAGSTMAGGKPFVMKSNSESADRPYGYMSFDEGSSNIQVKAFLYYDAASHVGTLPAYFSTSYYSWTPSTICGIYGSKDLVVLVGTTGTGAIADRRMFGHVPSYLSDLVTNSTDAVTSGSNKSIPVTSSAGFKVGMYGTIVGLTEGRDPIYIEAIPDATHIQVTTLARNYASGAFIGTPAMMFGTISGDSYAYHFFEVAAWNAAGTTDPLITAFSIPREMGNATDQDPDAFSQKYTLTPILFTSQGAAYGYCAANLLVVAGVTAGEVLGCNTDKSIPETGTTASATPTTLVDSGKSWTPDALIGKYIIITDGTGVGQVRKILDNDGTSVTVDAWATEPATPAPYRIADKAYRVVCSGSVLIQSYLMAALETDFTI